MTDIKGNGDGRVFVEAERVDDDWWMATVGGYSGEGETRIIAIQAAREKWSAAGRPLAVRRDNKPPPDKFSRPYQVRIERQAAAYRKLRDSGAGQFEI